MEKHYRTKIRRGTIDNRLLQSVQDYASSITVASQLFGKDAFRYRELWGQVDVVSLQEMTTKTDVLRILGRAHVTLKVSLTAAL